MHKAKCVGTIDVPFRDCGVGFVEPSYMFLAYELSHTLHSLMPSAFFLSYNIFANTFTVASSIPVLIGKRYYQMAPSVLGVGLSASHPLVPDEVRDKIGRAIQQMNDDMQHCYDWEMLYFEPEMAWNVLTKKLRERKWDVVLIGGGLRTMNSITPFFEKIVNTIHEELPNAKFAFNTGPGDTVEATRRALAAA